MEYINIENGNIVTETEMLIEGAELYDLFDPTNPIDYLEYYRPIV